MVHQMGLVVLIKQKFSESKRQRLAIEETAYTIHDTQLHMQEENKEQLRGSHQSML